MIKGYLGFVLHSHLPYVISHGEWPHGRDWLNEATAETYVPLLGALYDLVEMDISPKITLGLTPVLCEQLKDSRFKDQFEAYVEMKIGAAVKDEIEFKRLGEGHRAYLAKFWQDYYLTIRSHFLDRFDSEIVDAFRILQEQGHIEIITCAATHGYLPLLKTDESVRAQVREGVKTYQNHFGRMPAGIWLPECAYRPRYEWSPPLDEVENENPVERAGLEEALHDEGVRYFIVDSHLLKGGKPIGVYMDRFESLQKLWDQFAKSYKPREEDFEKSPYSIYLVTSAPDKEPVAIFTRDPKTALQVWSGEGGYPGDGQYLDFHKKHFPGGHRYWRVTDAKADLADKREYNPDVTDEILKNQADHFVGLAKEVLREHNKQTNEIGIVTAPFDTELFGHWWFEGPRWLKEVIIRCNNDNELELSTCGEHLERTEPKAIISIPEGSWGEGGFHYIWLNDWTKWTWKHVYEAEDKMVELAGMFKDASDPQLIDILNQAARELLLLESSDWQFLISTWSARDYAEGRVSLHSDYFKRLSEIAEGYAESTELSEDDKNFLESCKEQDSLFQDVDFRWWV